MAEMLDQQQKVEVSFNWLSSICSLDFYRTAAGLPKPFCKPSISSFHIGRAAYDIYVLSNVIQLSSTRNGKEKALFGSK